MGTVVMLRSVAHGLSQLDIAKRVGFITFRKPTKIMYVTGELLEDGLNMNQPYETAGTYDNVVAVSFYNSMIYIVRVEDGKLVSDHHFCISPLLLFIAATVPGAMLRGKFSLPSVASVVPPVRFTSSAKFDGEALVKDTNIFTVRVVLSRELRDAFRTTVARVTAGYTALASVAHSLPEWRPLRSKDVVQTFLKARNADELVKKYPEVVASFPIVLTSAFPELRSDGVYVDGVHIKELSHILHEHEINWVVREILSREELISRLMKEALPTKLVRTMKQYGITINFEENAIKIKRGKAYISLREHARPDLSKEEAKKIILSEVIRLAISVLSNDTQSKAIVKNIHDYGEDPVITIEFEEAGNILALAVTKLFLRSRRECTVSWPEVRCPVSKVLPILNTSKKYLSILRRHSHDNSFIRDVATEVASMMYGTTDEELVRIITAFIKDWVIAKKAVKITITEEVAEKISKFSPKIPYTSGNYMNDLETLLRSIRDVKDVIDRIKPLKS